MPDSDWAAGESPAHLSQHQPVTAGSLPRRALNLVYDWLDLHQAELLENWERLGKSEAPMRIDPLQ